MHTPSSPGIPNLSLNQSIDIKIKTSCQTNISEQQKRYICNLGKNENMEPPPKSMINPSKTQSAVLHVFPIISLPSAARQATSLTNLLIICQLIPTQHSCKTDLY